MERALQAWGCTVGGVVDVPLPPGSDWPLRQAVKNAFYQLTGEKPDFCFSGWGAKLDPIQQQIVEESHHAGR